MSRHANVGAHLPRHESAVIVRRIRSEHTQRDVTWSATRPVPLAVSDEWPVEVAK